MKRMQSLAGVARAASASLSAAFITTSKRGRKPKRSEIDQNDDNISDRVWKPSVPVLHMALALEEKIGNGVDDLMSVMLGDLMAPVQLMQRSAEFWPFVAEAFKLQQNQSNQKIFSI